MENFSVRTFLVIINSTVGPNTTQGRLALTRVVRFQGLRLSTTKKRRLFRRLWLRNVQSLSTYTLTS